MSQDDRRSVIPIRAPRDRDLRGIAFFKAGPHAASVIYKK